MLGDLEKLGFYVVGYGCTTCIGNSGPLPDEVSRRHRGERPRRRLGALGQPQLRRPRASRSEDELPRLAAAGGRLRARRHGRHRPDDASRSAHDADGKPVFLRDIWPIEQGNRRHDRRDRRPGTVRAELRRRVQGRLRAGTRSPRRTARRYAVGRSVDLHQEPALLRRHDDGRRHASTDIHGARVLGLFGDSITTDHISPAGNIKKDSPAGRFLQAHGVQPADFNSYGSRRGNDDVMVRGTFANIRIKNLMFGGEEGGITLYFDTRRQSGREAVDLRRGDEVQGRRRAAGGVRRQGIRHRLVARLGGQGHQLLGVKAVVAESFERIHRSNLVGMGVLPLQFMEGENAKSLGLTGAETFDIVGLDDGKSRTRDGRRARPGRREALRGARAAADAEGSRVLPPRRHPALRAAPAGVEESRVIRDRASRPKRPAVRRVFFVLDLRARHSFARPLRSDQLPLVAVLPPAGLDVVHLARLPATARRSRRSARR